MPATDFRDHVVVAGLSVDVREPGMFVALVAGGVAALVVRGDDGLLRAFSNTCRHRDPVVVAERAGPAMHATDAFTCPFAEWPDAHDSGGVQPLPVAEAHGVVLVRPSGGAPIVTGDVVDAATGARLDDLALDRCKYAEGTRAVVPRDWRAVVAELAARPGACTVAGHAVVVGQPERIVELLRVFPLADRRTVLDRRRYELTA